MKNIRHLLLVVYCITTSMFASSFTENLNESYDHINQFSGDTRPKYRIGFDAPQINHRQLLLTIDKNTTDGVDWGYEGGIPEVLPDDMYWLIEDGKYVIQATDSINVGKEISLGVVTTNGGLVTIKIDEIKNPVEGLIVALLDKEENEVYNLEENEYQITLPAGEYHNRFYITFLSTEASEDTVADTTTETTETSEESTDQTTEDTSNDTSEDSSEETSSEETGDTTSDETTEDTSEETDDATSDETTETSEEDTTNSTDETESDENEDDEEDNNQNNRDYGFNQKEKLVIYVNNGQGILNIKNKDAVTIKNVMLLNKNGQQVRIWVQDLNTESVQLPVHVQRGVYFVVVKTNQGQVLKRVLIQNS
ncbi:T9SS type A sorting domain-containing protein [Lutibacter holmesii]|uniref:T9SS type A sorting domain-containing protein n=1 Tax=Lutibacter holmesii TaxID=1137985 RepID=A0ABW3WL85_9FLAO